MGKASKVAQGHLLKLGGKVGIKIYIGGIEPVPAVYGDKIRTLYKAGGGQQLVKEYTVFRHLGRRGGSRRKTCLLKQGKRIGKSVKLAFAVCGNIAGQQTVPALAPAQKRHSVFIVKTNNKVHMLLSAGKKAVH